MDLHTLIWLFPVVFVFHDFEEIIMMEKWLVQNRATIYEKLPPKLAGRVIRQFSLSTAQFAAAVLVIFLFVSLSTFMASQYVNGGAFLGNIYMFTVLQLVFFIHVFTHVGQSILFRSITPGVITSVLFVLPYSGLMLHELLQHDLITWHTITICLPFVFLILPIVLLAHWIGKRTA